MERATSPADRLRRRPAGRPQRRQRRAGAAGRARGAHWKTSTGELGDEVSATAQNRGRSVIVVPIRVRHRRRGEPATRRVDAAGRRHARRRRTPLKGVGLDHLLDVHPFNWSNPFNGPTPSTVQPVPLVQPLPLVQPGRRRAGLARGDLRRTGVGRAPAGRLRRPSHPRGRRATTGAGPTVAVLDTGCGPAPLAGRRRDEATSACDGRTDRLRRPGDEPGAERRPGRACSTGSSTRCPGTARSSRAWCTSRARTRTSWPGGWSRRTGRSSSRTSWPALAEIARPGDCPCRHRPGSGRSSTCSASLWATTTRRRRTSCSTRPCSSILDDISPTRHAWWSARPATTRRAARASRRPSLRGRRRHPGADRADGSRRSCRSAHSTPTGRPTRCSATSDPGSPATPSGAAVMSTFPPFQGGLQPAARRRRIAVVPARPSTPTTSEVASGCGAARRSPRRSSPDGSPS